MISIRAVGCSLKAPVEFGAKYDVSIDEKCHARLEKIQFEPYNEGQILQDVIEHYKNRTGHYPTRVLVIFFSFYWMQEIVKRL